MATGLRADFRPEELSAVIARYDLGAIHRVDRQLKGSRRSPKVIITAEHGRFLLKRRAVGRDHPMKVAFAHAVQQYLATQDFPLPHLVPTRDGDDTMVIMDERIYEVFDYSPGLPYDTSVGCTADAGRVLAIFHHLLSAYEADWEPTRRGYHDANFVRTSLNGIPSSIGKHDSVAGRESELLSTVSVIYDVYENAVERVNEAGVENWSSQIVHGDWHPGNMLFLNGQVTAVIDYDSLHMLPAITDIANGALQFSILGGPMDPRQWPAELDEKRFHHFLASYDQELPIKPAQLAILPYLMIEALISEAVTPIAATGSFGRMEGFRFLQMILHKIRWLENHAPRLIETATKM